jgi:hypothetical protein
MDRVVDWPRDTVDGNESRSVGVGATDPVTVKETGELVDPASWLLPSQVALSRKAFPPFRSGGVHNVEKLPELSLITAMSIVHVDPESLLMLMVTCTAPGFWTIEPDSAISEPRPIKLGVKRREIVVAGLVKVVRVVDVLVLVKVWVQTVTVVVVIVVEVDVDVELVVVRDVDVLEVVVVMIEVLVDVAVAWIMVLVVWVVLVA